MMTKPFLSIITVTLNNYDGLLKTSHSIAQQNFKNFEWIIIDGQSTDKTSQFLKNCKADTIISETDNGIYDAMNKGIDCANGSYLLFLNAGDILPSANTLNNICDVADTHTDFIYGDALEMHKGQDIYKNARPSDFAMKGMFTHHQSMLYKRENIGHLRYNQNYEIAADYDFTLRFLDKAKTVKHIAMPLCLFETGGVSERHPIKGRIEQFKIRQNLDQKSHDNIAVFTLQTLASMIRQLSPRAYWFLKRFSLRA